VLRVPDPAYGPGAGAALPPPEELPLLPGAAVVPFDASPQAPFDASPQAPFDASPQYAAVETAPGPAVRSVAGEPRVAVEPLPVPAGPPVATLPPEVAAPPPVQPPATAEGERYEVRRGDTLASIAVRHQRSIGDMIALNELAPPYILHPGLVLVLPPSERQQVAVARAGRPAAAAEEPAAGAAGQATAPPRSGKGFLWPVQGKVIESFGATASGQQRDGITIAARRGLPVRATDNGVVVYAGEALRGYGQMILIRHADGYVSAYAHNSRLLVGEGQVVRRGEAIARVGDTGDAKRPQLHFELRQGTTPIDPMTVLVDDGRRVASRG
jgi:LysM repeat protein